MGYRRPGCSSYLVPYRVLSHPCALPCVVPCRVCFDPSVVPPIPVSVFNQSISSISPAQPNRVSQPSIPGAKPIRLAKQPSHLISQAATVE
uniref:Uncharacterized protein n=2 Tax=Picea TaxID=3328 RepID=A0A101M4F9_PICGL|nr:hypothetical protein ABT39_MTgene737 [Picea glauca]QHR90180.1 hypothetical protein Q903MT_gene4203 [Picea sitchensis]